MRKILYSYSHIFNGLFNKYDFIEKFTSWTDFRKQWDTDDEILIILPVGVNNMIGLDIRMIFREYGRRDNARFLLIGTSDQIEVALSQNDHFLRNIIDQVTLPIEYSVLELAVVSKIPELMCQTKAKNKLKVG